MKSSRIRWTVPAVALLAFAAGSGCLSDADRTEFSADAAASAASGESWVEAWDASGPPQLPTASDLTSALNLDDAQAAAVETALASWRTEVEAKKNSLDTSRSGRPGHGVPGGIGDFEPPMLGFLSAVVPELSSAQVGTLVELVEARRESGSRVEKPRGRRGRPGGRPSGGALGHVLRELHDELDVSTDERESLKSTMRAAREDFKALRESFREGSISAEELRDSARETRLELEADLATILGDERYALVEEALAEHRAEVASRRLEHLGDHIERRVEFLTKVLTLTDDQAASVTSVLEGTLPDRRALLEGLRDGTIDVEEALYQGYLLAEATSDAIRDLLTDEQREIFDSLKRLLPGHRPH